MIISNKFKKDKKLSLTDFSSIYDKSRRAHEVLNRLFELVEEKNSKTTSSLD